MKNTIPVTYSHFKKVLSEALFNLDHEDDERLNAIIDEYNRLEDELRDVLHQFPAGPYNFDSKAYKLETELRKLGVLVGGEYTEDGWTGEDYLMRPWARDKYASDPEFKEQVDNLKAEFEKERDVAIKNYEDTIRPYVRALNKFHNENWREIVRRGEDVWPKRDVPLDWMPDISLA